MWDRVVRRRWFWCPSPRMLWVQNHHGRMVWINSKRWQFWWYMITLWELVYVSLIIVGIREMVFKCYMATLILAKQHLSWIWSKDMALGLTLILHLFDEHHDHVYEFLDKFVVIIIDDLLVYSPSEEDDKQHLRMVLDKLQEPQLYASSRSIKFGWKKLGYEDMFCP